MKNKASLLDEMKKFVESPQFKAVAEKMKQKIEHEAKIYDKYFDKFMNLTYETQQSVIEHYIHKYKSGEYVDRWYSKGIEPPEPFFHFLRSEERRVGKEG